MGTIKAGVVVDDARRKLFELKVGAGSSTDTFWDRGKELLPLLSNGEKTICKHIPSAFTKDETMQLADASLQQLPADATILFSAPYNMGADGSTPGRAISMMEREAVACIDSNWPTAVDAEVQGIIYDQRTPERFMVYPRVAGTWYIQVSYGADPARIAEGSIDTAAISVHDKYVPDLIDYIAGYALLKNSRKGDYAKAAFFLNRFEQSTGITLSRQVEFAPLDQEAEAMAPNALGKA